MDLAGGIDCDHKYKDPTMLSIQIHSENNFLDVVIRISGSFGEDVILAFIFSSSDKNKIGLVEIMGNFLWAIVLLACDVC